MPDACWRSLHKKHAPIAALCHGPAVLLSAPERADGQWLFDGYRMTSFTDEEEDQTEAGLLGMEWLLDVALKNAGAVFDDGTVGVGFARRRRPEPHHRAEPGIDRSDRRRGHQETTGPGPPGRMSRHDCPPRQGSLRP